ncbi:hypothetical protein [Flavobacterium sp.]|uniref:hypothetical protein n=1 Tax=Flavobacterium sp. TaxID=239 RepID=UPI002B4AD068|nr:hypothetical protein [Flavobacterium sp.]HLF52615.1 hypothetical protein [Flavobacterium sp.]
MDKSRYYIQISPIISISYESIYNSRQSYLGKKLIKLLPYHHHKRQDKRQDKKTRTRINNQSALTSEKQLDIGKEI